MDTVTTWTSVDVVNSIISTFTPILMLIFGLLLNRNLKSLEQKQWKNKTVIEWRIRVYGEVAPILNDLFCYMLFIGNWKELTPDEVIAHKRVLDKKIYTSVALFSVEFTRYYESFLAQCFEIYRQDHKNAAIRSNFEKHKRISGKDWKDEWADYFSLPENQAKRADVKASYNALMCQFSKEIGLDLADENHNDLFKK